MSVDNSRLRSSKLSLMFVFNSAGTGIPSLDLEHRPY